MILFLSMALAGSELPDCAEQPVDAEAQATLDGLYEASKTPGAESDVKSRAKGVLKLLKKGHVCSADDHYKAGMVLLASRDASALETAHQLALVAAHNHVDRGKWLANNTFDRWQISLGNPQRFGTQTGRNGECLYPIDASFPDDNRIAWGGRTVTDTYTAFLKSREIDEPANATTLNSLGLFCRLEAW